MYQNSYDTTGSCSKMGTTAEKHFKSVVEAYNGAAIKSNRQEEFKHIDFKVSLFDSKFTVDVKAAKRENRYGDVNTDIVWVEFLNVAGNKGWLFGDEDFIAFETTKYNFVMFPRKPLAEWCKSVMKKDKYASHAGEALYRLYRRDGRKDLISKIILDDAKENVKHIVLKRKKEK